MPSSYLNPFSFLWLIFPDLRAVFLFNNIFGAVRNQLLDPTLVLSWSIGFLATRSSYTMPLADVGTLFFSHIVFLTHLVYFHLAFSHVDQDILMLLYLLSKLVARRPEDLDPLLWCPLVPKSLS
jgi:hypothetical protein